MARRPVDSRRDRVGPSDAGGRRGGPAVSNGTNVSPSPDGLQDEGTDPGQPVVPRKRRAATLQDRRLEADELFPEPAPGDGQTRILDGRGQVAQRGPVRGVPKGELIVRAGPVAGLRFALHSGVVIVGRSSQSDCAIPDEAVSRRHFELKVSPAGVQLRDLGSGNGTLVNGEKVEEAWLRGGDKIAVGDSTIEFRDGSGGKAGPRKAGGSGVARHAEHAAGEDIEDEIEPQTWFLSRLPAGPRRLLAVFVAALGVIVLLAIFGRLQKAHSEEMAAVRLFQAGRDQLSASPPDPDAALDDFERCFHNYPDKALVKEWAAKAQAVSDAAAVLSGARDLLDKKDLDGARKKLTALQTKNLPNPEYFDKTSKALLDEIDKRAAAEKAAQEEQHRNTVDPTTQHEASENAQRAKKLESSNPEQALRFYDLAYVALARRDASGPDFDQLKADYVGFLLREAKRQRHRNAAKTAALIERARGISPELVAAAEAPAAPTTPVIKPITRATPAVRHKPRPKRHGHAAPAVADDSPAPMAAQAVPASAPHKGNAPHVDEDRAEQLCDEGDALIGQDPDAARKRYSDALKYAKPGGEAAKRAQEGLSN